MVAGVFLVPPPPIPFSVPMTVLFAGSFLAGTGFFTTVALLESLESLIALPLPLAVLGAGAGAGVLLPRPTPVVAAAVVGAFRVAAPRVDFAFSTILLRILDGFPATEGFRGDAGRAGIDFGGGRIGDRGRVLELADLGDRT